MSRNQLASLVLVLALSGLPLPNPTWAEPLVRETPRTEAPIREGPDTHTPDDKAPSAQERLEALIDRLVGRLEPGLEALGDMLGDFSGWHAPEFLPNGDIIIRRRAQPEAPAPSEEDAPAIDPFEL